MSNSVMWCLIGTIVISCIFSMYLHINKTTQKYMYYDTEIISSLTEKEAIYMYIPLNKVNFSQSQVSETMGDGKKIKKYSKKIAKEYKQNNTIDFLGYSPPNLVYWSDIDRFQTIDNRRVYAAVKAVSEECSSTEELSSDIMFPAIIHHPNEKIHGEYKNKFKTFICHKDNLNSCLRHVKYRTPKTYGEAIIYRSVSTYDVHFSYKGSSKLPTINKLS